MSSPSNTVRVLGFAGSLRKASYNRALLRAAQELAPEGMTIDIFDLSPIPLYNFDVEQQGDPEPVTAFKNAIRAADAVLIATPEYQHGIPGVLKNALDWASRPPRSSPLQDKPAAILGATPGRLGTARAQTQLRQSLTYNRTYPLLQPEVLIASAGEKFDAEGRLTDEDTRTHVRRLLEELVRWTLLLRRGREA
ncbi:MAG: NADPH-dependent FMN reductase [Bryobacteraceae bacterium]